jgi:hypothetical protein
VFSLTHVTLSIFFLLVFSSHFISLFFSHSLNHVISLIVMLLLHTSFLFLFSFQPIFYSIQPILLSPTLHHLIIILIKNFLLYLISHIIIYLPCLISLSLYPINILSPIHPLSVSPLPLIKIY